MSAWSGSRTADRDGEDHSPLLEHIFCDPYPDFSQGAVDAARAYLEAIAGAKTCNTVDQS
jgi:hypothetical protein